MKENSSPLIAFLRISRPLALLGGLLFYALGAGVFVYLGQTLDWANYWLGQGCVTLLQLSSFYLQAYYDHPDALGRSGKDDHTPAGSLPRLVWLQAAITTLSIGAVLTVLLYGRQAINLAALVLLGMAFLISYFYAVPPVRLVYSGYGELTGAIFLANITPALAFVLQAGELHRLITMLTFPLTALYLAMSLALALPEYAADLKNERRTLLVRIGWQRGMNLHNLMVLGAYFILGLAALSGLPWGLTWPGMLTLPLGLYQIWLIVQINNGVKPRWQVLVPTAIATLGITTYLLTLALWTG